MKRGSCAYGVRLTAYGRLKILSRRLSKNLVTMASITNGDMLAAEKTKIQDSGSNGESRDNTPMASPSFSFTTQENPTSSTENHDAPKTSSPWAGIHANDGSHDHIDAGKIFPRISIPVELMRHQYDVVVVGSGYGGGVAASRMARGGQSVCLLELGKERWRKWTHCTLSA